MIDAPVTPSTRMLNLPETALSAQSRVTGPLDMRLPWVIEFRVVGTATVLQAQVRNQMILGRRSDSGKAPDVDLTNQSGVANGVSRQHAEIYVKADRLYLRDLHSTNGTQLNGGRCEPGLEYRLHHGDELTLGKLKMQVSFTVVPAHDTETGIRQMLQDLIDSVPQAQAQAQAQPTVVTQTLDTQALVAGGGESVLVVESDSDVASVFRLALEKAGFNVTVVPNAAQGLSVIFGQMPQSVIVEATLPDMSGADLVRFIRKQSNGKRVALLVVGGSGGFLKSQAYEAGADQFLAPPVAADELVRVVYQTIQQKRGATT